MSFSPYTVVDEFEKRIAEWCGAPYAVSVESCTAAIFLSLQWNKINDDDNHNWVSIPSYTYPSLPCSIIHSGFRVIFREDKWEGEYRLQPFDIWDAALRFKKGMYHGGFQCLSFHVKKHLPIGRGGMILCEDKEARDWFRKARFDGRNPVPLQEDDFDMLGWNVYLEPSQAARGIQLFEVLRQKYPNGKEDLVVEEQGYPNLAIYSIYQQ